MLAEITTGDAFDVLYVTLSMLVHYRECLHLSEGRSLPLGILKMALAHLDSIGANTAGVREEFKEFGVDFGPPEDYSECSDAVPESDVGKVGRSSRNRIPAPVEEAIRTKYHAGWSKSRIAREFRLNRRTVIRICSGK